MNITYSPAAILFQIREHRQLLILATKLHKTTMNLGDVTVLQRQQRPRGNHTLFTTGLDRMGRELQLE